MDVITLTTSQSILTGSSLVNTIDGDDTGLILGTDDEVEDARARELFSDDFSFEE
jgi:hypothetical protein